MIEFGFKVFAVKTDAYFIRDVMRGFEGRVICDMK